MSLALVYSRALSGMNAPLVEVEAHLANGLPHFNIVGLPDTEVKESRDRVRAAIIQSGFDFPAKKITVNLAPADLPKESGRFDLPIALGILAASGQINPEKLAQYEFAGELALSGLLRPVRGALAMAWQGMQAGRSFVLPQENAEQAAVMRGIAVYGARSLGEVAAHLNGIEPLTQTECKLTQRPSEQSKIPDLADVKGQHTARLALEIAAAGGHSLLMMGPFATFARYPPAFDRRRIGRSMGIAFAPAQPSTATRQQPSFPQPSSQRQLCCHGRRRFRPTSGRNLIGTPRCVVFRRIARV